MTIEGSRQGGHGPIMRTLLLVLALTYLALASGASFFVRATVR
jgi:hypothetical protein